MKKIKSESAEYVVISTEYWTVKDLELESR